LTEDHVLAHNHGRLGLIVVVTRWSFFGGAARFTDGKIHGSLPYIIGSSYMSNMSFSHGRTSAIIQSISLAAASLVLSRNCVEALMQIICRGSGV
jgi:hypothetical protein